METAGTPTLPTVSPGTPNQSRAGVRAVVAWLRSSRLGLVVMALFVGSIGGLGAVGFRWLIFAFTWLATGHEQFGQQGRVPSLHLSGLGIWFFLLVPVIGGIIYGPLVDRFAKEARGHGVPEVMLAVAENGGRIRPPVTVVKALASAICIGTGGSVGREGPIVQIGSAFASTMGQVVRMSENRLRVIVACGAAAGISATFNAPLTGLFFGFEIVLREFSLEALFGCALAAVSADLVSRAFFGAAPFFTGLPHDLSMTNDVNYLLIAVLGVCAGLVGWAFKTVLYKAEDTIDRLWRGRPEWARPAVGGIALGALLLALPQAYGVGYPVMDRMASGRFVLWMLVILMIGKVAAASLTLSIGGSGGVFAPSLFVGAAGGMAFGLVAHDILGSAVSAPAVFAVTAMGGVFGAAAQAPLTAIASVAEMTGNFSLVLPVILTVGISSALAKKLSYGSIYTTKLLRRGIDIERPTPSNVLQVVTVNEAMQRLRAPRGALALATNVPDGVAHSDDDQPPPQTDVFAARVGTVTDMRRPQALFADETLEQALRQLALFGRAGLPVVTADGQHLEGWLTRHDVLLTLAERFGSSAGEAEAGALATEFSAKNPQSRVQSPTAPLDGYEIVEVTLGPASPATGQRLAEVEWPAGAIVTAVTRAGELTCPDDDMVLKPRDRVVLLAPAARAHIANSSAPAPPSGERPTGRAKRDSHQSPSAPDQEASAPPEHSRLEAPLPDVGDDQTAESNSTPTGSDRSAASPG